jgi:hypothetical protein
MSTKNLFLIANNKTITVVLLLLGLNCVTSSFAQASDASRISAGSTEERITEPKGDVYRDPKLPKSKLAHITFYRPQFGAMPGVASLEVNGRYHSALQLGSYTELCVAPGRNVVAARMTQIGLEPKGFRDASATLNLLEGEKIYLRLLEQGDGRATIAQVRVPIAIAELRDTDDILRGTEPLVLSGTTEANATVAVTLPNNTVTTTTANSSGVWSITPTNTPASIRYVMVRRQNDGSGDVYDYKAIFALGDISVMSGGTNVASGKTAKVSWGTTSTLLTDGSSSTFEETGVAGDVWVQIDLGANYTADSITLTERAGWSSRYIAAEIYTSATDMSGLSLSALQGTTANRAMVTTNAATFTMTPTTTVGSLAANGTLTYSYTATDVAGNVSTSTTQTVTVDTGTMVITGTLSQINSALATVTYTRSTTGSATLTMTTTDQTGASNQTDVDTTTITTSTQSVTITSASSNDPAPTSDSYTGLGSTWWIHSPVSSALWTYSDLNGVSFGTGASGTPPQTQA